MSLSPYALATVEQTKAALNLKDDRKDAVLEECVNEASQMVEQQWGRHLVSRGALTEYHPAEPNYCLAHELLLNEWPIVSVTSVHEDSARVYGASALLVVDTDYLISKPTGKLIRVSSALPLAWMYGWRAIKVVYVAGYQNTDAGISGALAMPASIKRVFNEITAWMFKQRTGGEVGLTQVQDGFGNRTFSGPAYITPAMAGALSAAGAVPTSMSGRTGARDA